MKDGNLSLEETKSGQNVLKLNLNKKKVNL